MELAYRQLERVVDRVAAMEADWRHRADEIAHLGDLLMDVFGGPAWQESTCDMAARVLLKQRAELSTMAAELARLRDLLAGADGNLLRRVYLRMRYYKEGRNCRPDCPSREATCDRAVVNDRPCYDDLAAFCALADGLTALKEE